MNAYKCREQKTLFTNGSKFCPVLFLIRFNEKSFYEIEVIEIWLTVKARATYFEGKIKKCMKMSKLKIR